MMSEAVRIALLLFIGGIAGALIGAVLKPLIHFRLERTREGEQQFDDSYRRAVDWAGTQEKPSLRGLELPEAKLDYVNLEGADLKNCNFKRASLKGARLSQADLRGADLQEAYLARANLSKALLDDANLRGAYLNAAHLEEASLEGADLRGAVLAWAFLSNASLKNADLRETNLVYTLLDSAELANTKLDGARWGGTVLVGAILPTGFTPPTNVVTRWEQTWTQVNTQRREELQDLEDEDD